jgi:hypothetical protein
MGAAGIWVGAVAVSGGTGVDVVEDTVVSVETGVLLVVAGGLTSAGVGVGAASTGCKVAAGTGLWVLTGRGAQLAQAISTTASARY